MRRAAARRGHPRRHRRAPAPGLQPQRPAVGRRARGRPTASTTPASGPPACARATSTAATPTRPCGPSRTPSPSSRAPRTPWPSAPAWAPSPRPCSPCARPATTSSSSARSTPARSAFVQGPCARLGIEHTVVDGTAPGAFAAAVRPGRTMLVIAETPSNPRLDLVDLDELGADQRTVHRSSTRRSPRRSASSRCATASTSSCTRRRRASAATTTPRSASSPASATCSTRSGPTPCCTAPAPRPTTPSTGCAASARSPCASATRPTSRCASPRRWPATPVSPPCTTPACPTTPSTSWPTRQLSCLPTVLAVDLAGGVDAARAMLDALRVARSATSLGGPETLVCHSAHEHPRQPDARGAGGDRHHARPGAHLDRPRGRRRHRRRPRAGHPDLTAASRSDDSEWRRPRDGGDGELVDEVVQAVAAVALDPAERRRRRRARARSAAATGRRWPPAASWRCASRWPPSGRTTCRGSS